MLGRGSRLEPFLAFVCSFFPPCFLKTKFHSPDCLVRQEHCSVPQWGSGTRVRTSQWSPHHTLVKGCGGVGAHPHARVSAAQPRDQVLGEEERGDAKCSKSLHAPHRPGCARGSRGRATAGRPGLSLTLIWMISVGRGVVPVYLGGWPWHHRLNPTNFCTPCSDAHSSLTPEVSSSYCAGEEAEALG